MRQFLLRGFYLLLAIGFLFLALIVIDEPVATSSDTSQSKPLPPLVSYIEVKPDHHASQIALYGELEPRWDVTIKAQVTGEVKTIAPVFEAGTLISQGAVLVDIDDTRYQAELSNAELNLSQAELALWQAKEKTELARKDWARSGFQKKPSDLVLFLPQLSLSKHNVKVAERLLSSAQRNLSYTQVKAPFSGVITERYVGLGQLVFEGDPIVRVMDHQHLLLKVSLNEEQWMNLAEDWQEKPVPLFSTHDQLLGYGKAVRGGHRVDQETRQYPLYLEVTAQTIQASERGFSHELSQELSKEQMQEKVKELGLIPGKFVRAKLPGKAKPDSLRLPQGAVTREGLVWIITPDNTLRSYTPTDVLFDGDHVIVSPPTGLDGLDNSMHNGIVRVATTPLAFYLSGLAVQPVADDLPVAQVGN
ncbi:efflux RND transporter periplasmic adaptor subunit [Litoribrevibacter albus]|uniref:Multidrug resistance protein MdtA-like barrel-sandwich hybrid domain-containing protein n=1 Tax=Litoribrevibacter albus TaxID=1473156 RepID=A0AA37S7H2_9GAMM|nr:efflux RND transporter periplasmic adaptor subunit [Litoribrevibacter albus]GLQ29627.1 hypothetical protein GCM10007876_01050 [Litoribrevibacter albus]